jgi:putative IMPACT (imprinted ancient) family translation regulator
MSNLQIDFGGDKEFGKEFVLLDKVIKDKGSVYSVSAGKVECREDVIKFIKKVRSYNKKFLKATHHTYVARISKDGVIYETKNDDGEAGAGNVILRVLQKQRYINTVVCVTRWFGGVKLYGDRFKHVQDATMQILK